MRLFRARGLVEHGQVASGSTTQGLWPGDSKVGSQIIGKDQSRLPRRGTVEEIRRGGRRASDRTKEYTYLGLDLGEREEQVVCHASALA